MRRRAKVNGDLDELLEYVARIVGHLGREHDDRAVFPFVIRGTLGPHVEFTENIDVGHRQSLRRRR